MISAVVRLRLQARSTLLEFSGAETVTLPVGIRDVADNILRHDPPTPAELERAIDVFEDALSGSRLAQTERGALMTVFNSRSEFTLRNDVLIRTLLRTSRRLFYREP